VSLRHSLAALIGLVIAAASPGIAYAASEAYCALYAREYAIDTVQPQAAAAMLQSVQDQAYYRCLNQDEDPQLPQTPRSSGYFSVDAVASAPIAAAPDAAKPQPTAVPSPVIAKAAVVAPSQATVIYHGSGLTPWTAEWQAWCAKYFPNSWDPKTGTVIHQSSATHERVLCK
jgi:hypothetical protein